MTRWAVALGVLLFCLVAQAGEVRVENRLLLKQGHVFLTAGPALLDRADYHLSPGLAATASWFIAEDHGLELRAGWLFSQISASAREVMAQTGLELDAPLPRALVLGGYRYAFGYGKLLAGGRLIHFDLTGAVHAGALFTRAGAGPALSASPGLLLRTGPRLFALVDVAALATWERGRRRAFNLGVLPSVAAGVRF